MIGRFVGALVTVLFWSFVISVIVLFVVTFGGKIVMDIMALRPEQQAWIALGVLIFCCIAFVVTLVVAYGSRQERKHQQAIERARRRREFIERLRVKAAKGDIEFTDEELEEMFR